MQVAALIQQLEIFSADVDNDHDVRDKKTHRALLREAAQQVADELVALQSIFGDENVEILPIRTSQSGVIQTPTALGKLDDWSSGTASEFTWQHKQPIRLCITIPMDLEQIEAQNEESSSMKISATLPAGYPQISKSPQLQLLSRYIGSHGVDHFLFGQVLKLFHHGGNSTDHLDFHQGEVILFDAIEKVREKVEQWYSEREAQRLQRKEDIDSYRNSAQEKSSQSQPVNEGGTEVNNEVPVDEHQGVTFLSAPAITERKSVFVGHCAILTDVSQVGLILSAIIKDKKVSRATHPTMHAWICKDKESGVIYRDCDDDGETAAGGRLAHLLDLLHLENVIIVVTRWYGGVHLGPDRFKLINRAARDALEMAQLVPGALNPSNSDVKSNNRK